MLVYENYAKFISATDTIRSMKVNVEGMDASMQDLRVRLGAPYPLSACAEAHISAHWRSDTGWHTGAYSVVVDVQVSGWTSAGELARSWQRAGPGWCASRQSLAISGWQASKTRR